MPALLLALALFSDVAGTWRGQSLCTGEAPACRNETVVYTISDLPDRPDTVLIRADKIVDGKPVTMGTGEWHYDRAQQTLSWRMPQQVWHLQVDGNRIAGTLTLTAGAVIRRMQLTKDQ